MEGPFGLMESGARATLRMANVVEGEHPDRVLAVAIVTAGYPLSEAYAMTQRGELQLSDEAHRLLVEARNAVGKIATELANHLGSHDS